MRGWFVVRWKGDLQRLTAFQTWYFPDATVTLLLDQLLIIMNNVVDKFLMIWIHLRQWWFVGFISTLVIYLHVSPVLVIVMRINVIHWLPVLCLIISPLFWKKETTDVMNLIILLSLVCCISDMHIILGKFKRIKPFWENVLPRSKEFLFDKFWQLALNSVKEFRNVYWILNYF